MLHPAHPLSSLWEYCQWQSGHHHPFLRRRHHRVLKCPHRPALRCRRRQLLRCHQCQQAHHPAHMHGGPPRILLHQTMQMESMPTLCDGQHHCSLWVEKCSGMLQAVHSMHSTEYDELLSVSAEYRGRNRQVQRLSNMAPTAQHDRGKQAGKWVVAASAG